VGSAIGGRLVPGFRGALITEFSGIAGVAQLVGVPVPLAVSLAALVLVAIGLAGAYQRVEWIGIALGSLEVAFVLAAVIAMAHGGRETSAAALWHGMTRFPVTQPGYMFLLAANVGAVIMPWMIFYQQGAVVDKGWTTKDLRHARRDTAVGAVVTQIIMVAIVVTAAATLRGQNPGGLQSVTQIAAALTRTLGPWTGRVIWGAGIVGAAFIAALVASVAGAWGISEVLGIPHSLNQSVRQAPWFYLIYGLAHVAGAVLVILSVDLVQLSVDVEVMNAMLLPIVLGFLLALEARALPHEYRMHGFYRWLVWSLSGLVMAFGLYTLVGVL